MIQAKQKPCKGTGNAKGYGCGKPSYKRTLGCCDSCIYEFYTTSEIGKVIFEKRKLKLKTTKEKAFKSDLRQKIKTLSDYQKELQKEINTIVRLIDKGGNCISSGKPLNEKYDAGHFYSVGSNPSLRFNLHNIHAQSVYANQYLSGDQMNYLNGLKSIFGVEYMNYVISLKKEYPILKIAKEDYKEKISIAKEIIKELKEKNSIYKPFERKIARDIYNLKLGIY